MGAGHPSPLRLTVLITQHLSMSHFSSRYSHSHRAGSVLIVQRTVLLVLSFTLFGDFGLVTLSLEFVFLLLLFTQFIEELIFHILQRLSLQTILYHLPPLA